MSAWLDLALALFVISAVGALNIDRPDAAVVCALLAIALGVRNRS